MIMETEEYTTVKNAHYHYTNYKKGVFNVFLENVTVKVGEGIITPQIRSIIDLHSGIELMLATDLRTLTVRNWHFTREENNIFCRWEGIEEWF